MPNDFLHHCGATQAEVERLRVDHAVEKARADALAAQLSMTQSSLAECREVLGQTRLDEDEEARRADALEADCAAMRKALEVRAGCIWEPDANGFCRKCGNGRFSHDDEAAIFLAAPDAGKRLLEEHAAKVAQLERGYVPQDIAQECLRALAPLDVVGEPNTLWALVHKAMRLISEHAVVLAAKDARIAELEARFDVCDGCGERMDIHDCPQ